MSAIADAGRSFDPGAHPRMSRVRPRSSSFVAAVLGVVAAHGLLLIPLGVIVASGISVPSQVTSVAIRLISTQPVVPPPRKPPVETPDTVRSQATAPPDPGLAPQVTTTARGGAGAARAAADSQAREIATSASLTVPDPLPVLPAPEAAPPMTAAQPALPPAPDYLSGGVLDPGPRPLQDIQPEYPLRAGRQRGVVVLRLLINEQGVVDNVAVVRSSPQGYFEESAVSAFGKALFSPGRLLGAAVKAQVTIEIEFTPINRGAAGSSQTY